MISSRKLLITVLVPLLLLSLAPSILAQETSEAGTVTSTSVVLAVDNTGSMTGERLNAVEAAVESFFAETGTAVPVALVAFNESANILVDYTTNVSEILTALEDMVQGNNTALYDGLYTAVQVATDSSASNRVVLFLTDGTNGGSETDINEPISLAVAENVIIDTIALGPDANRSYLQNASNQTGGNFYSANSFNLPEIYAQVAGNFDMSVPASTTIAAASTSVTTGDASPQDAATLQGLSQQQSPGLANASAVEITDQLVSASVDGAIAPIGANPQTTSPTTALVLAIDNTGSITADVLADISDAIDELFVATQGNIPVALIGFNEQIEIAQPYTYEVDDINAGLATFVPTGRTALYDATVSATALATETGVENAYVILLTDGTDSTSDVEAEEAIRIATEANVRFDTIALGVEADQAYLRDLAQATGGELTLAADSAEFTTIFTGVGADLLAVYQQSMPSIIDTVGAGGARPTNPFGDGVTVAVPDEIAPLNADITDLNLDSETAQSSAATASDEPVDLTEDENSIAPDVVGSAPVQPELQEFVPINILVDEDANIKLAELSLNQVTLAVFDEAPYEYLLRANALRRGNYSLSFAAVNANDVVSRDTLDFVVDVAPDGNRQVLIEGEESRLTLFFSQADGLAVVLDPVTELERAQAQTLSEILLQPFDNIPAPLRTAVTQQRPGLTTAVIVIMTIILLPQGIFTLYWMTYTWVNPERLARSGAPKREDYYEPKLSFTALLPARKEESVIYDTIRTVDNIDYPEELKEILILIRDEDDDETIEQANRAIEDIKADYEERGEVYPENVHLVTFTEGPYNKPNGLNRGYKASTKEVLCIFDAEDAPHPDIYSVINTVMQRDNADVVQAGVQLMNYKSTWFSSFNVLEYFFWFKSGLHAFTHGLDVTPLGGNTVFFKNEWMDKLAAQDTEKGYRAWDEGTLTEDADVGFRLTTMGASIQIVYEAELATQEETPDSIEQFIKQRTRWCQGFYEIFQKGDWLTLPTLKQRIAAIYILLNSLLQASILLFLPIGLYIALTQRISVPITLLSYLPIYLMISQMVITLVGMKEFAVQYNERLPFGFRLKMILFYYPYQLLLSISAMRAVFRFLTNQSSWEKTAHSNLHRQTSGAHA